MVNQWEIYFCNLDPVIGSEQRGSRPVLVISNNAVNHALPVATVAPLSSVKAGAKIYPSEILLDKTVSGLAQDSVAMLQQIRTLSHERLTRKISYLSDASARERIRQAIRDYFTV